MSECSIYNGCDLNSRTKKKMMTIHRKRVRFLKVCVLKNNKTMENYKRT